VEVRSRAVFEWMSIEVKFVNPSTSTSVKNIGMHCSLSIQTILSKHLKEREEEPGRSC
jgi:hypothetical protein